MEPKFHSEQFKRWFYKQVYKFGNLHWTETGVDLIVENAEHHDTVKFEQLNDFFMTLDAPHLREGNLQKLFDAGLERPEDILNLTQQDLALS